MVSRPATPEEIRYIEDTIRAIGRRRGGDISHREVTEELRKEGIDLVAVVTCPDCSESCEYWKRCDYRLDS